MRGATTSTAQPQQRASGERKRGSSQNRNDTGSRRRRHRGCQNCTAFGKSFKGNSYFSAIEGCTNHTVCICRCGGSWNCPARYAQNICEDRDSSAESGTQGSCNSCSVKGKTFEGGRNFSLTDGCTEYKECMCRCDGSWECPASRATNICTDKDSESRVTSRPTQSPGDTDRCRKCVAKGKTIAPESLFDLKDKCMEYSNCECYCNGSWQCPPSHARNVCSDHEDQLSKSCKTCHVYGDEFEGDTNFTISRGCWEFRNCVCSCDGSWNCPGSSKRYVCDTERSRNRPKKSSVDKESDQDQTDECGSCNVNGKMVKGDTYFNVTDGDCYQYTSCKCDCYGEWACLPQSGRNICAKADRRGDNSKSTVDTDSDDDQTDECRRCNAKGKIVTGGQYFNLTDGCYQYTSCRCGCNGAWKCPPEHARYTCSEAGDKGDNSGCTMCKATDGSSHRPNQPFTFIDDCIERNCDCFCNGSWSCPGARSRWICTDRCRGCEVEGRQVVSNAEFKHKTGCLEYTCNCHCNGSWSCPGETVKNTCPVGVRDNCNKCQISATEQYPGESDFVLKQGCLHYKCRCNCDGSYSCPAEDSRNVCYGEKLGGCRSCVLSENEIYQGGSKFDLRRDCNAYQCQCYCNGTWTCPAETQRNTCIGEVLGGCKMCEVDGKTFRGDADFEFRRDCIHYQCKCNCDGSWNCPGSQTRNVCKGEVPGGCRSCIISEDEFYPGNSTFDLVKDCYQFQCKCGCDGSYDCPVETARRVCVEEPDGRRTVTQRPRRRQCQRCYVSERKQFDGDTEFSLTAGCYKYMCACNCNGTWDCPAERATNICSRDNRRTFEVTTQRPRERQCRQCYVPNEGHFEGNTTFSFTRGCDKFSCSCDCDGKYRCPSEKTEDVCDDRERPTRRPNTDLITRVPSQVQCRRCRVTQREEFQGNATFSLTRGCEQFNCFCQCDGTWDCPAERTTNICDNSSEEAVTQVPRQTQCQRCHVSDRKHFEGDTDFSLERGCYKFMCSCRCNGSWECPAENVIDICRDGNRNRNRNRNGARTSAQRRQNCKVCRRDGREYIAGSNYTITQGCQQFQCYCLCDGSSDCDLNNPKRICSGRRRPVTTERRGRKDSCRPCTVRGHQISSGQEFHIERGCMKYSNCQCRCSGQWQCAQRERVCDDRYQQGNERVVVKFEGTPSFTRSNGYSNQQNRNQQRVRSRETESSAWVYVDGDNSSFLKLGEKNKTGGGYKIEVKTKYVPTFNYGDDRRAGQLRENRTSRVYTTSGSTPSKERLPHSEAAAAEPVAVPETPTSSRYGLGRCNKCIVDDKRYPSGAHFDMRRKCVVYKCLCMCSGSYRCRPVNDNACTEEEQPSSCRNCLYQGLIFPGGMDFTFRDGCLERQCNCHCNGTHTCPSSKPVPGCSARSAAGQLGQGSFYPVQHHGPTSVGYIRRTGKRVFTYCPSCGIGTPPVYHTPVRRAYERPDPVIKHDNRRETEVETCRGCDVEGEHRDGETTFSFQKDCVEFDCYCACGGSWKCSGRPKPGCTPGGAAADSGDGDQSSPDRGPARLVRGSDVERHGYIADESEVHSYRAVAAQAPSQYEWHPSKSLDSVQVRGCKNCYLDGKVVATLSTFVRKVGCVETVCRCECAGNHICPSSASVNVCELRDNKPMRERKGECYCSLLVTITHDRKER